MKMHIASSLALGSIAAALVAASAFAAPPDRGVVVMVEVRGGARPDHGNAIPVTFEKPANARAGWCAGDAKSMPLTFAFSSPVVLGTILVGSRGAAVRVEGDGKPLIMFQPVQPGHDLFGDLLSQPRHKLKGMSAKTLAFRLDVPPANASEACIGWIVLTAGVDDKRALLVPMIEGPGKESFAAALDDSLKVIWDCDEAVAGRLVEFPLEIDLSLRERGKVVNPRTAAAYKEACDREKKHGFAELQATPAEGGIVHVKAGARGELGPSIVGWKYDLAWTKNGWKLRKLEYTGEDLSD